MFKIIALLAFSIAADTVCPAIYKPVCGKDGKMYSNSCVMANARVKQSEATDAVFYVYEAGSCVKFVKCPENYEPVCGVDGNLYDNPCLLSAAGVEQSATLVASDTGICVESNSEEL
jgi:hypothetical protein